MKQLNTWLAVLATAGALMFGGCEDQTRPRTPQQRSSTIHSQAEKRFKEISPQLSSAKQNAKRIVHVGLAKDARTCDCFDYEISEANLLLRKYGIFLELAEQVEVNLPNELLKVDSGIKLSFSNPKDYYFAITNSDYSREEEDWSVYSMTYNRICITDRDLNHESLDKVISQEILRFLAGEKDSLVIKESDPYFSEISENKIRKNLRKQFFEPERKPSPGKHRTVTVNVILDGTTPERAGELIGKTSERFTRDFGISFRILGTYKYELPKSWDFARVYQEIFRGINSKSDLYLLFTDKNWREQDQYLGGQASSGVGFGWICSSSRSAENIALHEVGHIFEAPHIYLKDSIMYPETSTRNTIWGERIKDAILKNKFKRWH